MAPQFMVNTGSVVVLDVDYDGRSRRVGVTREAIEDWLALSPVMAVAMSPADRDDFVREHLSVVQAAAEERLIVTSDTAELVMIMSGEL